MLNIFLNVKYIFSTLNEILPTLKDSI